MAVRILHEEKREMDIYLYVCLLPAEGLESGGVEAEPRNSRKCFIFRLDLMASATVKQTMLRNNITN
jgi:hypothetical protein